MSSPDILGNVELMQRVAKLRVIDNLAASACTYLLKHRKWAEMNTQERKICMRGIIASCSSEDELRAKLTQMQIGEFAIMWDNVDQNDQTAVEAQTLVRALGGMVAKNGAMVSVMTYEDQF